MPKTTDAEHIQQAVQQWLADNPVVAHVGATSECGCSSPCTQCVPPCRDCAALDVLAMCGLVIVAFLVGASGVWLGRVTAPKQEESAKPRPERE